FFDRLRLAPVPRVTLIAGPMVAAVLRSFLPFGLVLVAGLLAGAQLPGGVLGGATLYVAAAGAAVAAAGWSLGLALRIKTVQSGALMQVGIFVAVFLSTAQVPLSVMTGWL